jgi:hypothetical protein
MKIESRFRRMIVFLSVGSCSVFGGTAIRRIDFNTYEICGRGDTKTVQGTSNALSAALDHWYSYHEKGE